MLKSIGRYRCVLISVSMGQLRVNLARSVEKDEGAALFAGRCLFVFPHRTRGKRKASTPIRKGGPDGTICNLPERNKDRPLPGKDYCARKPYPGAFPKREGEAEKRD